MLTRWAGLAGLAALVGGLVMAVVVLPPGDGALGRRLTSWSRSWVGLLLVTSAGELLLRAGTMAGGGLAAGLTAAPAVLARTHFGTIWSARAGALILMLVLVGCSGRAARTAACGAAFAVTLTTSLVGHAADRGDLSPIALIDWLHVTAAAAWTGGLFFLAAVVLGEARTWPRARRLALLQRFSTLAGGCLVAVVASGIFNACVELGSLDALWTTRYGTILIAKVLLVLAVASLGAANRYAVLPRLGTDAGPSGPADARLVRYVACEAGLALLVFGCTALLTESAPPRHHADAGRLAREASMYVWCQGERVEVGPNSPCPSREKREHGLDRESRRGAVSERRDQREADPRARAGQRGTQARRGGGAGEERARSREDCVRRRPCHAARRGTTGRRRT